MEIRFYEGRKLKQFLGDKDIDICVSYAESHPRQHLRLSLKTNSRLVQANIPFRGHRIQSQSAIRGRTRET